MAFTGAEETDHYGLRSILVAQPQEMSQAVFIDLEGVGSEEISYVTRHGIGLHYYPDEALIKLAQKIAQENLDWEIRGEKMVMSEEVSTLTHLGFRALCISGRDPLTGGMSKWHQTDDIVEYLNPFSLLKAKNYTRALLQAIDQEEAIQGG